MATIIGRRGIVGGGQFHEVALSPGETLIREGYSRVMALPWPAGVDGKLFLTNLRLIWVRTQFSLFPWFRRSIEIDLRRVRICRVTGGRLWFLGGQALAVGTESDVWLFSLPLLGFIFLPSTAAYGQWKDAITEALPEELPPSIDTPALGLVRKQLRRAGLAVAAILGVAGLTQLPGLLVFPSSVLPFWVLMIGCVWLAAIGIWATVRSLETSLR